jgi:galactose mutarotase-like enzyme
MPVAHGYHPYFDIPHGRKDEIQWDFSGGQEVAKTREIWQNGDTYCFDNPWVPLKITIPWVWKLSIEVSPDFKRFWIWSLPWKSFVCIEPVIWDEDSLIKNPLLVENWMSHDSFMKISLEK